MKRILLTGGSGFIGRNIRESFLADEYEICAPTHAELDLLDVKSVDGFFADKSFDAVLHTATKPAHRNAKDLSDIFLCNLKMFEHLARHADKFGKFVNFGSGAVYDNTKDISGAREEDFGLSIGQTEHSFAKYAIRKRIDALPNFTDLNIFGIFGKYEDYAIRFISNALCKALCGMPVTLGQNRRFSYVYIDDIFPIIKLILEKNCKFNSYNIVPPEFVELKTLAEIVSETCGKAEIKIARSGFGLDYYGCGKRLLDEFPQIRFTDAKTAIGKLANYYKDILPLIDKNLLRSDK